MFKSAIVFFLLGIFFSLNAQQIRRDGVWCFGNHAMIDFNQTPPQCGSSSIHNRGTSCSITDSSGNLLFSCQTGYLQFQTVAPNHRGVVFTRNGTLMDNGDSLIGTNWYYDMIIIPDPANNNTYYILHTAVTGSFGKIYYSKVDLNYNGGLGRVTDKNVLLDNMNFQYASDGISAIKHGNGRDYWVICHLYSPGNSTNNFHKFLITPNGIQLSQQNIGPSTVDGFARLYFNNRGDKLYLVTHFGLLASYSFDRCSGVLSEPHLINPESINGVPRNQIFAGATLSPNDGVLYLIGDQAFFFLYQLDLNDPNPFGNKTILDVDTINSAAGGFIKLAPDGKIYLTRGWQGSFPYTGTTIFNSNLSVINDPDQIGSSCNYQSLSFSLGAGRSYVGLQNSPYFDMPAAGGTVCDTLGIYNALDDKAVRENSFYPNPSTGQLSFSANAMSKFDHIQIMDITGMIVYTGKLNSSLNVSFLETGMYTISFLKQSQVVKVEKLIVSHQ